MIVQSGFYRMELDDVTGALVSLGNGKKEFIQPGEGRPLFTVRFRDQTGKILDIDSSAARSVAFSQEKTATGELLTIRYSGFGSHPFGVTATVRSNMTDPMSYWRLTLDNPTELIAEWIDFPEVVVPNDLTAEGGTGKIVWPGNEGVLVEDVAVRESSGFRYIEPNYPSRGTAGIFPGAVPTQFMAYYEDRGGLYFGAHDDAGNVKCIEYYPAAGGIRLQFRLYPEAFSGGTYRMTYDMVLGVFEGDWHDAAEIYRSWFERFSRAKPTPIEENDALPAWYGDSPVVVTYPVRGRQDMDVMTPNRLFPYAAALPHLDRLSEALGSRVMALLMHWEGTAPWAPPYVWPPYGGEAALRDFAQALHERGDLLGVYCSGLGWTEQSNLIESYNCKEQFDRGHLENVMCLSPEGTLPYSNICTGQRRGYDMCPSQRFTTDTIAGEAAKMIEGGCDYIQAFDQNHGGASYFCYSRKHGHPPAPGRWQTKAMQGLFERLRDISCRAGKKVLFGCESVAAEPFIPGLAFSDARYNLNYFIGTPIPLYAYVYHRYVNNFMGNQVTAHGAFDYEKSPDCLLYRLAYSFSAGDMATLVITEDGTITWNWGIDWSTTPPDQEKILTYVRRFNAWRRGAGKAYLFSGEMVRPFPVEGGPVNHIFLKTGRTLDVGYLLSSCWRASDASLGQVFTNYSDDVIDFDVTLPAGACAEYFENPDGSRPTRVRAGEDGRVRLHIGSLSTALLRLSGEAGKKKA